MAQGQQKNDLLANLAKKLYLVTRSYFHPIAFPRAEHAIAGRRKCVHRFGMFGRLQKCCLGHAPVPIPRPAGGIRQHPPLASPHRQAEQQYGLYEVVPGIYQVRGFDLAQTTFVRGKTGWIVFDTLVSAEPIRAAWKLLQQHVGAGLLVTAVIYSHSHADHWGGVRGVVDEADVRSGKRFCQAQNSDRSRSR